MQNPLLILAVLATALSSSEGARVREQPTAFPREATFCDLSKDPEASNHVRVRLTAVATHEFESFSLSDPTCGDSQTSTLIWLTYGGRVSPGTIYWCPGEGGQSTRPKPLVIEGVALTLAADAVFQRFRKLLGKQPQIVLAALGGSSSPPRSGHRPSPQSRAVWCGAVPGESGAIHNPLLCRFKFSRREMSDLGCHKV
jgi:hypothetical protein